MKYILFKNIHSLAIRAINQKDMGRESYCFSTDWHISIISNRYRSFGFFNYETYGYRWLM
jgi:hypothetical protein